MDAIFRKVEEGVDALFGGERHSHTHLGAGCSDVHPHHHRENRYNSFARPTAGNAKWYVDGCSYFWAVSEALQRQSSPDPYPDGPARQLTDLPNAQRPKRASTFSTGGSAQRSIFVAPLPLMSSIVLIVF